jgi:acyl-CoA synthetase (AMP-forming)/AMP-acid ligase II
VLKSMFTRSGFNIYPREIEHVVAAMPGVRAASVSAVPDAARENEIAVAVVGDVAPDDVKRWCASNLSAYKQPAEVTVRPA